MCKRLSVEKSLKREAVEQGRLEKALADSLEQQTATSEILRTISSSPTDIQPVFEAIARSAMRLCEGSFGVVARYDGELMHFGAFAHVTAKAAELAQRGFPQRQAVKACWDAPFSRVQSSMSRTW